MPDSRWFVELPYPAKFILLDIESTSLEVKNRMLPFLRFLKFARHIYAFITNHLTLKTAAVTRYKPSLLA